MSMSPLFQGTQARAVPAGLRAVLRVSDGRGHTFRISISNPCASGRVPWPYSSVKMTKAAMERTTTETSIAVIGSMNHRLVKSMAVAEVPVAASEA